MSVNNYYLIILSNFINKSHMTTSINKVPLLKGLRFLEVFFVVAKAIMPHGLQDQKWRGENKYLRNAIGFWGDIFFFLLGQVHLMAFETRSAMMKRNPLGATPVITNPKRPFLSSLSFLKGMRSSQVHLPQGLCFVFH